jgi:hypothetical protein
MPRLTRVSEFTSGRSCGEEVLGLDVKSRKVKDVGETGEVVLKEASHSTLNSTRH